MSLSRSSFDSVPSEMVLPRVLGKTNGQSRWAGVIGGSVICRAAVNTRNLRASFVPSQAVVKRTVRNAAATFGYETALKCRTGRRRLGSTASTASPAGLSER